MLILTHYTNISPFWDSNTTVGRRQCGEPLDQVSSQFRRESDKFLINYILHIIIKMLLDFVSVYLHSQTRIPNIRIINFIITPLA